MDRTDGSLQRGVTDDHQRLQRDDAGRDERRPPGQDHHGGGDTDELDDAERIILPGVGAFDAGMGKLLASGMIPTLRSSAA